MTQPLVPLKQKRAQFICFKVFVTKVVYQCVGLQKTAHIGKLRGQFIEKTIYSLLYYEHYITHSLKVRTLKNIKHLICVYLPYNVQHMPRPIKITYI